MQNHPSFLALDSARNAVLAAIAAGILREEDDPWHTTAGAHPAEEAMDSGEETTEWAERWTATMAEALRSAEVGRGVVRMTDAQRSGW